MLLFCLVTGRTQKAENVNVNAYSRNCSNRPDKAKIFLLQVHVYTFRNEDQFLLWNYGADPYREYEQFLKLGVDGYFTDFPWSLSHYMELLKAQNNGAATQACASPFLIMSITIIFLFFT